IGTALIPDELTDIIGKTALRQAPVAERPVALPPAMAKWESQHGNRSGMPGLRPRMRAAGGNDLGSGYAGSFTHVGAAMDDLRRPQRQDGRATDREAARVRAVSARARH